MSLSASARTLSLAANGPRATAASASRVHLPGAARRADAARQPRARPAAPCREPPVGQHDATHTALRRPGRRRARRQHGCGRAATSRARPTAAAALPGRGRAPARPSTTPPTTPASSSSTAPGARRGTCCATRRSWRRWSASRSASRRRRARAAPPRARRPLHVDRRGVRGGAPPHRTDRARRGGRGGARARDGRDGRARAAARAAGAARRAASARAEPPLPRRRRWSRTCRSPPLPSRRPPSCSTLCSTRWRTPSTGGSSTARRRSGRTACTCCAAPRADEIIGAVRLTPRRCESVGDLYFVRSLCVASEWRRRGLGTRLLRAALAETAGRASYAFPFAELAPLYRAAGFRELPSAEAPAWLEATRAKVAGQQRGRVVLMVREWPGRRLSRS